MLSNADNLTMAPDGALVELALFTPVKMYYSFVELIASWYDESDSYYDRLKQYRIQREKFLDKDGIVSHLTRALRDYDNSIASDVAIKAFLLEERERLGIPTIE